MSDPRPWCWPWCWSATVAPPSLAPQSPFVIVKVLVHSTTAHPLLLLLLPPRPCKSYVSYAHGARLTRYLHHARSSPRTSPHGSCANALCGHVSCADALRPSLPSLARDNDLLRLHQRARIAVPRLLDRDYRAARHAHGHAVLFPFAGAAAYLGVWAVLAVWGLACTFLRAFASFGGSGEGREIVWIGGKQLTDIRRCALPIPRKCSLAC